MSDTVYETSDPLFVDLLNIACYNPATLEGYFTYRVETHCLAVIYTARPLERDDSGRATRYIVIKRDYEACQPIYLAKG